MKQLKITTATDRRKVHIIKTLKSCPWCMYNTDQAVFTAFKAKW